jgi:hypothetical protein
MYRVFTKLYKLEIGLKNKKEEEIIIVRTREEQEVLQKLKILYESHRPLLGTDRPP